MGRRGKQTYKILRFVVGPLILDFILTDGSILDRVMRYGSICANNRGGRGVGEPVIYATVYSNNFETGRMTRPGLLNLRCRKDFLGT